MPRMRNPVGIATGKLIIAIQNEWAAVSDQPDGPLAQMVLNRAHTLLQASRTGSVSNLLDGRTLIEYLGAQWVETHPSVKPSIDLLIAELGATHPPG